MPTNINIDEVAIFAGDYWRLLRLYERLISDSPPEKHNKLKSSFRNAERRLLSLTEKYDIEIVTYEDKKYTPNLAVVPINADDFNNDEQLIISQMVEPTVMRGSRIINMGKAILRAKEGE